MPNRRRTTIFRASAAPTLDESGMMTRSSDGLKPEVAGTLSRVRTMTGDSGSRLRVLFQESTESGDGFSLVHVWFKAGYALPRHTHNVDCLYYVIGGELRMGSTTLRAGDGFFVPANHPYAYSAGKEGVEVLEFRNATSFDVRMTGLTEGFLARAEAIHTEQQPVWAAASVPPSWARTAST